MTGFGTGAIREGADEYVVEIRSLNHKFSEVKLRVPRELSALEPVLVRQVKARLARGAIEVQVRRRSAGHSETVPTVDLPLARAYLEALQNLGRELGLTQEVRLREIASQPGVMRVEERALDLEAAARHVSAALDQALANLDGMRGAEGEALQRDLEGRLAIIETLAQEIAQRAPASVGAYRSRLEERLTELGRAGVDPQRLAQEVALFAERTDIAEEMTRLASHLAQFRAFIASAEPIGRKMDFLVQELHREVNTTGSKSQDFEISQRVVALKAEVERLREQVQNVE